VLGVPLSREFVDHVDQMFFQTTLDHLATIGDVKALLTGLAARGLRLGLMTNDADLNTRAQLRQLGLDGLLEFVAAYDSGHGHKPDPDPVLAFAAFAGVAPAQVAVVGDTEHDLAAARAAGAVAVGVLSGPVPRERLLHCPMDLRELIERHLAQVCVMHIEPAVLRPPGDPQRALIGASHLHHSLAPFLWELAMRGPRRELLPEIKGPAVYRVAPSLDLDRLPISSGVIRMAIERLRRHAVPLTQIASWPAFDRECASRLLNALYLQAGLMVSRSHPDAVRESWFGGGN